MKTQRKAKLVKKQAKKEAKKEVKQPVFFTNGSELVIRDTVGVHFLLEKPELKKGQEVRVLMVQDEQVGDAKPFILTVKYVAETKKGWLVMAFCQKGYAVEFAQYRNKSAIVSW